MARHAAKINIAPPTPRSDGECLIDDDRLALRHLLYCVDNAFAPDTVLRATERHIAWAERTRTVDHNAAHLELMGEPNRVVDVLREDARLQAVLGLVRDPHGFVRVLE